MTMVRGRSSNGDGDDSTVELMIQQKDGNNDAFNKRMEIMLETDNNMLMGNTGYGWDWIDRRANTSITTTYKNKRCMAAAPATEPSDV